MQSGRSVVDAGQLEDTCPAFTVNVAKLRTGVSHAPTSGEGSSKKPRHKQPVRPQQEL